MNKLLAKCPQCQQALAGVHEGHPEIPHLYFLSATKYIDGKHVVDPSTGMYLRVLFCENCKHVEFVNAILDGLVDAKGNAL